METPEKGIEVEAKFFDNDKRIHHVCSAGTRCSIAHGKLDIYIGSKIFVTKYWRYPGEKEWRR